MKLNKEAKLVGVIIEINGEKKTFDKFSLIGWSYESEEPGMSDSGVDLYFRIDGKEHKIAANSVY